MGAFKGAVEVGAEGLETDIHLSKDGVVVLSHVSCSTDVCLYNRLTRRRTRTLRDALAATRSSLIAIMTF